MKMMQNKMTKPGRRGVALLMVMIALVVGTILTAGFLATQGTSLGIARNTRDHDRCREVAESGVDMCIWQAKNRSDWRAAMTPGNWLQNVPVAGGTVTVVAADGDGSGSFSDNTTQPVVFTSTGTVNGRTYTVGATVTPTGGGTPWSGGTFANNTISINDSANVDSYDSTIGIYLFSHSVNAELSVGSTSGVSLSISAGGLFSGTLSIPPLASLFGSVSTSGSAPTSISNAPETRVLGKVVGPNLTGFTNTNTNYAPTTVVNLSTTNQTYKAFTLNGGFLAPSGATVTRSAVYYITGNMDTNQYGTLTVNAGKTVVFVVDGNVTLQGNVVLKSGSQLQIYTSGNFEVRGSANVGTSSNPGQLMVFGMPNAGWFRVRENATFSGAIYAPSSDLTVKDYGQIYGSTVTNSLTMQDHAQMHQDTHVKSLVFHNITGGSYMGDYLVKWMQ